MTFIGLGTAINVATIVVGSLLGLALGSRLNERTRTTITHVLGLCTLVMGATTLLPMMAPPLAEAIPGGAVFLVAILVLLAGTVIGSLLRLEDRTESLAAGAALVADVIGAHPLVVDLVVQRTNALVAARATA